MSLNSIYNICMSELQHELNLGMHIRTSAGIYIYGEITQ